ncbi:MAG TPA: GAF domain-containing sensor histidine kinase [Candidatus Dormibacteraeota bacterium]|jgi:signal transduction histidine kinase
MERAGGRSQLTRDAGGLHLSSLRLVPADESASVILGATVCLTLLSMALVVNVAYGVIILYAFPIAMSAWLFGRWIGIGVAGFAVLGMISVALIAKRSQEALPVAIPALVLVTVVSIAASEWAQRSESLVVLLNQRERRHRQMLETMTKVGQELVTSKRWEAIAEHSLASLARDLELDMAWMFRRGGQVSDGQLTLLAFHGQAPLKETTRASEGTLGQVLRTGQPLRVESTTALKRDHPEIRPSRLEEGIQSRLVLPVFVKGATSGVVLLATTGPRTWNDEEIGIASAIVNQLGLAMENASAHRSTIEALVRMEEISQMKSDFLKTVSHELRTPLTVLMGYVDMMEDGSLGEVPDGWTRPMAQLRIKMAELNRLVKMMLEASRAEGPTLKVNLEQTDISATIRHAVEAQLPEVERVGHRLTLHLPTESLIALCDRDKLLVVLRNLVENAVKYSPDADEVEVGFTSDDASISVWVADRGMGIPEAEREHIFEQFHRVQGPDTASIGGSGLGLFIVRQLVAVQGGWITVSSREGGGTVFSITLPRQATMLAGTGRLPAVGGGAQARRGNDMSLVG